VKYRVCLVMLSAAVLSSAGLAQMPSRFDLTGNLSFGNAQFVSAPNTTGSGQVRAFGWQTSGISHFSRWLGLSSQFSGGYASANAIQLIGYTGAGKVSHYSMLAGPRITFASRSRINPFIEGLGGTDYATTRFTSNGTVVTGNELQSAYAFGGGAQINVSRRVGFNVEAHYFDTQHSVALLGWTPSHLQISAGLVFRLSPDRRIVVDQQPLPVPSPSETQTASVEPTTVSTPAPAAPVTTMVVTAAPSVETAVPQPVLQTAAPQPEVHNVAAESQVIHQQPVVAAAPKPAPAVVAQFQPSAVVTPTTVAPALSQIAPNPPQAQTQAPVAAPVVAAVVPSRPIPTQVQTSQPQPVTTPRPVASSVPATSYVAAPAQPLSLGEYARKLREKKQHKQADWQ
jgi:hypothetical protein